MGSYNFGWVRMDPYKFAYVFVSIRMGSAVAVVVVVVVVVVRSPSSPTYKLDFHTSCHTQYSTRNCRDMRLHRLEIRLSHLLPYPIFYSVIVVFGDFGRSVNFATQAHL